jgi:DNA-binding SARP family transcriptional activator
VAPPEIQFRILGPIDVSVGARPVPVGGRRSRALLAILLLTPGEVVSSERLADGIWGDHAPPSAHHLVQVYISQLRAALDGSAAIVTREPGYLIDVEPSRIDAWRFERLVEDERATESRAPQDTIRALEEALALWRGPALADTRLEGAAAVEVARLDGLRLTSIEARIDALLAVGREPETLPELERLVASEPLRERFAAQLMLALYRSGRQADALSVYQRARRHLTGELGLEPSPELQQLQQAILRHDPELTPTRAAPRPAPRGSRQRGSRRVLRGAEVTVMAILVLAVLAVLALLVRPSSRTSQPAPLTPRSLAAIDATTGAIIGRLPLGGQPDAVSVDADRVWVALARHRALVEIKGPRMRVVRTFALSAFPRRLAAGDGRVWVANAFDGTVTQVDAGSGRVSAPWRPAPSSTGRLALAYGAGSLWIGSQDNTLTRVDPSTGRTTARISVTAPEDVAVGLRSAWVAQRIRAAVLRVDTTTNRVVRSIPIGAGATAVTADAEAVWALAPAPGRVWRIDPDTNAVTAVIDVGPEAIDVATAGGSVWIAAHTGVLQRISPRTDTIVQTVPLDRPIGGIAADRERIWITVR